MSITDILTLVVVIAISIVIAYVLYFVILIAFFLIDEFLKKLGIGLSPTDDPTYDPGIHLCPHCRAETGDEDEDGYVICPGHGRILSIYNYDQGGHFR